MMVGWFSGKNAWHFQRRLYHHFGIVLDHGEYSEIRRRLRRGKYQVVGTKRGANIYLILIHTQLVPVVVDTKNHEPITAYSAQRKWLRYAEEEEDAGRPDQTSGLREGERT